MLRAQHGLQTNLHTISSATMTPTLFATIDMMYVHTCALICEGVSVALQHSTLLWTNLLQADREADHKVNVELGINVNSFTQCWSSFSPRQKYTVLVWPPADYNCWSQEAKADHQKGAARYWRNRRPQCFKFQEARAESAHQPQLHKCGGLRVSMWACKDRLMSRAEALAGLHRRTIV